MFTIEGNYFDAVKEVRSPTSSWIGFGRPRWDNITIPINPDPEDVQAKMWAINQGIMIGREDGDMHWEDDLKRDELAIVLYRYWNKFNK